MESSAVVLTVISAVVGLLIYFLKVVHGDVRNNTEEVGKIKGRLEQLNLQISQEKELRQTELKHLDENMQKSFANISEKITDLIALIKK